jgi:hypothetical protein
MSACEACRAKEPAAIVTSLTGIFRPTWCGGQRSQFFGFLRRSGWGFVFVVMALGSLLSCSGMPPLEVQEEYVRNNELRLHQLTPPAFVGAWGTPTYQHTEFMQFFGMKDDSLIPRSRVASGEPPRGWEVRMESGDALFLAYPDHGWLVVFFEERLVYSEALTAAQLHALGRSWKHEEKFRSRFEAPAAQ